MEISDQRLNRVMIRGYVVTGAQAKLVRFGNAVASALHTPSLLFLIEVTL